MTHLTKADTTELRALLEATQARSRAYIEATKGNQNPQILEMRHTAQGRYMAMTATIDFLDNWKVPLRIEAAGLIDAR